MRGGSYKSYVGTFWMYRGAHRRRAQTSAHARGSTAHAHQTGGAAAPTAARIVPATAPERDTGNTPAVNVRRVASGMTQERLRSVPRWPINHGYEGAREPARGHRDNDG